MTIQGAIPDQIIVKLPGNSIHRYDFGKTTGLYRGFEFFFLFIENST